MEEKGRRECGKRRWARRSTLGRSPKPTDFIPPLQALGPCRALHPRVKPQSTNKYQSIHGLSCLLKHRLVPFLSSFQGRILNQCSIGWVSVKIWGQWDCAIIRCSRFGPSSQSYGFSSSHVWMWELDYKESWAPKNWCFWTVVLEKTLESPLDCKEIQPVHSKGDQSWIFIGRTNAEAETPKLWPPDVKNWLIWKDPDAGKDWRQEEKGMTEDEIVGWHHWLNGHEFE